MSEAVPFKNFLRTAFTVYWQNSSPSTEIFYWDCAFHRLTPTSIATFEQEVLALMQMNDAVTPPQKVVFAGYIEVDLSHTDVQNAGWHVICDKAPIPVPPVVVPPPVSMR